MKSEQLSFIDLVKCKNILAIAQKAEQFNTKCDNKKIEEKINFDWFVRFFESAGSISDQDMQDLWARILNEEIQKAGKFSFRTLDVFFKMDKDEILAFQYCAKNKLISPYGEYFLLNPDEALVPDDDNMGYDLAITEESDISSIMAATYNINSNVIRLLEGAELLSSFKQKTAVNFSCLRMNALLLFPLLTISACFLIFPLMVISTLGFYIFFYFF